VISAHPGSASAKGVAHVGEDPRWPPADRGERAPDTSEVIAGMAFPQVARLQLDELLEQMVARARDVQNTQGRLRGLLRANLEVARGVDLDEVLRHIVDASRELAHARYAAIGVMQHGCFTRFVNADDEDLVARLRDLPEGSGLLGPPADRPQRLGPRDTGRHLCSPGRDPPVSSFLSMPLKVGDRVFGSLYLAGKEGADEFTADDEDLVSALAAAAGFAIGNANLFAEARRRHQWQAAMVEITTQLLTGVEPGQALRQMVRHALRASGADSASVTVPTDDPGLLRVAVAEGGCRAWQGEVFPVEGSASAIAMSERRAVLVTDLSSDPRIRVAGHCLDEVGAALIAPLAGERGVTGALVVSRFREKGAFDAADLDMIAGFAGQAALALQLDEARRDNERLRLLEDRERIGEDLQHSVIHRLFAAGLSIQSIAARVSDPEVKGMINYRVEEIDDIIGDIRATVFALRTSGEGD
jgi:GAF domain-containing protein